MNIDKTKTRPVDKETEIDIEKFIKADDEYRTSLSYKLKKIFYYPYSHYLVRLSEIPGDIKVFWQRGRRGYARSDAWAIDYYLDSFMPELLRHMIDKKFGGGNSYPGHDDDPNCDTYEHWQKTVEKMAKGFEASRKMDQLWEDETFNDIKAHKKEYARLEKIRTEGMTLFVKYYNHLWD